MNPEIPEKDIDHNLFITKEEKTKKYENIKENLRKFYEKYNKPEHQLSLISKMATASAALKKEFDDLKFVGFYIVENSKKKYLEIGPYVSDIIATPVIKFGAGVCGSCWEKKQILIENDVSKCKNYIACDEETKSEIVVPVYSKENREEVIAVWDIDSVVFNRFDDLDSDYISYIIEHYV